MNLGFSEIFPKSKKSIGGKKTYFVEKIFQCFNHHKLVPYKIWADHYDLTDSKGKLDSDYMVKNCGDDNKGKIHTFRHDDKNRWKIGSLINFVIGNRTKERLEFIAPVFCTSIQKIIIEHSRCCPGVACVIIDGILFWEDFVNKDEFDHQKQIVELAKNDGFDSVSDFFNWFDEDFEGKIIHWTSHKY